MSGVPHKECERLRERLPEYADGSLAGPARVRIEAHLGRCPRCAAELEDLRTMLRAVHSVTPDEVPDDLLRRVREAVRARPPAPAGLPRLWPRIAVPVALAAGVVAIGFALRAPREAARLAGAPHGAVAQDGRIALSGGAARGGARGSGFGRAAGGRAARGPVVVAEATEEARRDLGRHAGGANVGWEQPAESQDLAAERAREPVDTDRFLYADRDVPQATTSKAAPGPPGPSGTAEKGSALKPEREGTAARGIGGLGGGGMGARARRGDDLRAGAPSAETRSDRSGAAHRFGPRGDRPARGPLERKIGGDREGAVAGACEVEVAPTPSLSATLGFAQYEGRPALTLQLASDKPVAGMSVYVGEAAARRLVWQGSSLPTAPLVLTPDHIGPAPAATPIAIEAGEERRNYLLFTPTLARLGEVAGSAPAGAYSGESVAQALADLTALTGLVVLAEEPLSRVLSGNKPGGAPDAALRELAARAELEVERAGDLVFNLKHPR